MINIWNSLVFLFICYSFANIVVFSHICEPVRELMGIIDKYVLKTEFLGKLINCITCFGFWAGVIISLITDFLLKIDNFSVFSQYISVNQHPIWLLFFNGVISSGACWTIYMLLEGKNEKFLNVNLKKEEKDDERIIL